jgi:hypothetical protein
MAIVYGYTVLLEALIWCYIHFEKGGFIWGLIHSLLLVFWREWGMNVSWRFLCLVKVIWFG